MPISVDNLIKILPAIIVILIGIWLFKKIFNILIAVVFIAVVIFVISKYIWYNIFEFIEDKNTNTLESSKNLIIFILKSIFYVIIIKYRILVIRRLLL